MIEDKIYNYYPQQLIEWLTNEAGSSNPDYFHATKAGGLKLQQVPQEYATLLLFLKERKIESYLALGIGNGGSFALECFFMKESLAFACAVDNMAYGKQIGQNSSEVMSYIDSVKSHLKCDVFFMEMDTNEFFKVDQEGIKDGNFYDAIMIDADHSYEGVKKDFDNSLKRVRDGGVIIFHDINSEACPGIKLIWKQVKDEYKSWEFVHSTTCGIGIIEI